MTNKKQLQVNNKVAQTSRNNFSDQIYMSSYISTFSWEGGALPCQLKCETGVEQEKQETIDFETSKQQIITSTSFLDTADQQFKISIRNKF